MRIIITCGCGDTTQFAKEAFKILYPDEKVPKLIEMNDENKPLIKLFMLTLCTEKVIDEFLDSKFAIAIDIKYRMQFDIITEESIEGADIYIKDLIKGCDLELC